MNQDVEIDGFRSELRHFAQAISCCRTTHNYGRADRLTELTLERAKVFGSPPQGVAVRNWLYAILVAFNRYKPLPEPTSAWVNTRASRFSPFSNQECTNPSPVYPSARQIVAALSHLSLEEREVLLLIVLQEFSYDDTAFIVGLPKPIVIARLARARSHLIATIEESHAINQEENFSHPTYLRLVQ